MATKKGNNSYVGMELEWLEKKATEIREYCNKPIHKLTDRLGADGKVIAKIEDQVKSIRETLKDYILIVEAIDKLRDKEASKGPSVRGDQELSPFEKGEI
jgi:hypothetical protein